MPRPSFFNISLTKAVFQGAVNTPSLTDVLTMFVINVRRLGRAFFSRSIGIGSSSHIFVGTDFMI